MALILAVLPAHGQGAWSARSPGLTGHLHTVFFHDASRGWASADEGIILVTVDSGTTWSVRATGSPVPLRAMHFAGKDSGWAGGASGEILRTLDGGGSWEALSGPVTQTISGIHFPTARYGWAVAWSGEIQKTSDGGETWFLQDAANPARTVFHAVSFVDSLTGWAVGDAGIVRATRDGGETWQIQDAGMTSSFRAVHALDRDTVWASGNGGQVRVTHDGGETWEARPTGIQTSLPAVRFIDARTGWVAGSGGFVLRTVDGGRSWVRQDLPGGAWVNALAVSPGSQRRLWAAGDDGSLHARDIPALPVVRMAGSQIWGEGQTISPLVPRVLEGEPLGWEIDPDPAPLGLVFDTTTGMLGGVPALATEPTLFRITAKSAGGAVSMPFSVTILGESGGSQYWTAVASGAGASWNAAVFRGGRVWLAGGQGMLLTTQDGFSWTIRETGETRTLRALGFAAAPDSLAGWAVGEGGALLKTSDGGENWLPQSSGRTDALHAVHAFSATSAIAAGDAGTLLRSADGGATWTAWPVPTTQSLRAVCFVSPLRGWLVGGAGTILSTEDGGLNWSLQSSGTTQDLRAVSFADSSTGWIAGDAGTLLKTSDGGETWIRQATGVPHALRGVSALDAFTVWVAGDAGTMLKSLDGGAIWQAQPLSNQYGLRFVRVREGQAWSGGAQGVLLRQGLQPRPVVQYPSPQDWPLGTPILPVAPPMSTVDPGTGQVIVLPPVEGWRIQPDPAALTGLLFDTASGTLFGTPVRSSALQPYTVTAFSHGGASTAMFELATGGAAALRSGTPPARLLVMRGPQALRIPAEFHALDRVTLVIHDARGGIHWTRTASPARDGVRVVAWDGRDRKGAPLASGTYYLRFLPR